MGIAVFGNCYLGKYIVGFMVGIAIYDFSDISRWKQILTIKLTIYLSLSSKTEIIKPDIYYSVKMNSNTVRALEKREYLVIDFC